MPSASFLLEKDLDIAINDAVSVINTDIEGNPIDVFDGLSSERQDVLVDMSFNLGRPRFKKFAKMIEGVQEGNFDKAADEILDSNAARDPKTKARYENLAKEMRGEKDPVVSADSSVELEPLLLVVIEELETMVTKLQSAIKLLGK